MWLISVLRDFVFPESDVRASSGSVMPPVGFPWDKAALAPTALPAETPQISSEIPDTNISSQIQVKSGKKFMICWHRWREG